MGTTMTCPLRVLIGADTYPPDINGAARFTTRLAAGLARRGHEVHVVAPSDTGAARVCGQVPDRRHNHFMPKNMLQHAQVPDVLADRSRGGPGGTWPASTGPPMWSPTPQAVEQRLVTLEAAAAAHDLDATLDAFEDVYSDVRRGAAGVRVRRPVAGER
jgi:hypothetical protein